MLTNLKHCCNAIFGGRIFEATCQNNDGTSFKGKLHIKSLEHGKIANTRACAEQRLDQLAYIIEGCFNPHSNAFQKIREAFGKDSDEMITFHLTVNGVIVVINKATCDPQKISENWWNNYMIMHQF